SNVAFGITHTSKAGIMSEPPNTPSGKPSRRRKIQALLAGGTVLGVGALVTLAAWTDDEFALGEFGASSFNLEGTAVAADADYTEHDGAEGAATLTFDTDALNMVPEQTVYAPFWVRLDADTNVDGTIEAETGISVASASGENAENLSLEVYHGVDACDTTAAETGTLVASGSDLTAVDSNPVAIDLTSNESGTDGEEELLCFAVTSADEESFLQGGTAAATWQVQATSNDEG
ncbi:MAG: SipW-dependent-type signal peptide-containing protein, partial [Yaniella sp.]|uniref:SipW-dependent-type signal peptide-containing protein n=1 Tax=Yaniella sp. TaxID=2773929 RepID=UPI002647B0D9